MRPIIVEPRDGNAGWVVAWLIIVFLVLLFFKDPSLLGHMARASIELLGALIRAVSA